MGWAEEGLAAAAILDKNDPTLLTYKEIKESWGSCLNFFISYGLKPWDDHDCEEARYLSRQMKGQE